MKSPKTVTFLKQVGIGFLIGIGAVAPGISGGAIAVIFGLYQKITGALAHLLRDFRRNVLFLLPLGLGGLGGVILCGHLIEFCFSAYPLVTRCVFMGLMLGTLPSVLRDAGQHGFHYWYLLLSIAALFFTVFLVKVFPFSLGEIPLSVPLLLFCGIIIGLGTIVPGISTSFTLMALGLYDRVLHLVNQMDIRHLCPILAGFVLFVLLFSRLVDVAYRKAYGAMSFLVVGLLLGSLVEVFPPALLVPHFSWGWLLLIACSLLSYFALQFCSARASRSSQA